MFAATMDELSGSRFNLGLAAGAGEFLKWVGIEQGATLAALRETIEAVRRLQAGERAAIEGRFLHWSNEAYLRFTAPRCTPIYIGAMGPKMLALSGELADGALPLLFPPEHYFGVLPYLQEGMARRHAGLGRAGPGSLHLGFARRRSRRGPPCAGAEDRLLRPCAWAADLGPAGPGQRGLCADRAGHDGRARRGEGDLPWWTNECCALASSAAPAM